MGTRQEVRTGLAMASADEDSDSALGSGDTDPRAIGDGFRVRVSLEQFFTDERARVLVWAERGRSAGWLLRRLRASLPLPADAALALVAGDCLVPPAEPLAVLRPDDLLQVIISSSDKVPAAEETEAGEERSASEAGDELEAVKRRALSILAEVEAGGEVAAGPRRRRRVRRRRAAVGDHAAAGGATPARWCAELDAGAGVVRAATPARAARLVTAASPPPPPPPPLTNQSI